MPLGCSAISHTWQDGHAPFRLSTGDAAVDAAARSMAKVFNMWSGGQIWNSPTSVMCLHELSWMPMAMSIYAPNGTDTPSVHDAMQAELDRFADTTAAPEGLLTPAVFENGFVWARMNWNRFFVNGGLHDQVPHFLLAYYYHATNTGDAAFVRRSPSIVSFSS